MFSCHLATLTYDGIIELSHFSKFRVGYIWHTRQFSTEFQLQFLKLNQEINKNKEGVTEVLINITLHTNVLSENNKQQKFGHIGSAV